MYANNDAAKLTGCRTATHSHYHIALFSSTAVAAGFSWSGPMHPCNLQSPAKSQSIKIIAHMHTPPAAGTAAAYRTPAEGACRTTIPSHFDSTRKTVCPNSRGSQPKPLKQRHHRCAGSEISEGSCVAGHHCAAARATPLPSGSPAALGGCHSPTGLYARPSPACGE